MKSLRDNDWYITAFDFSYNGYEYVVGFENLREIDRGIKYYAAMFMLIDKNGKKARGEQIYRSAKKYCQNKIA